MRKTRKSVSTKKEISQCKTAKEKQEDFIMLPTVDFCFKELMQNDNIRKNIIAALLNVPSSEVENTELMPTILRKESKDDKYGILDVRVKLKNGEQIDFEMQVEAFDCWANRSVYYLSKMYTSEMKEGCLLYTSPKIENGEGRRILFVPTGALMSTVSFNEGASVQMCIRDRLSSDVES